MKKILIYLKNISLANYEINTKISIISIQNTQKNFNITLSSSESFSFCFSYGFSNNNDYFYNNNIQYLNGEKKGDKYIFSFELYSPFRNLVLVKDEFFSFMVKV